MTLLALIGIALAADCPEPVALDDLTVALDAAETAWEGLDEYAFQDGVNGLIGRQLPCLQTPIPAPLSARLHRAAALHLSLVGDEPGAEGALRAARGLEPDYAFTDAMLPESNPLRGFYDGLAPSRDGHRVPEPRFGSLLFDGENTRLRPDAAPSVLQVLDGSGLVTETVYLAPGQPLPDYRAIPRKRNALLAGSGGALLGGVALYAASFGARSRLIRDGDDLGNSQDQLDKQRATTNALSAGSAVLFGVAIGGGVGAYFVGEQ